MTWELQAPVSDDIHRLVNDQGQTIWGVDHQGFDTDHPEALGVADVDLPSGSTSLLLVEPLAGGLVLDAVRSYQGLVEGELCTLFLGIVEELWGSTDAQSRLCLESIGLDAEGRPRIIPGISRTSPASPRFAIGEMIYHAAHGRPWAQSPLPVRIALPGCSQPLQTLVEQLLDDSTPPSSLHDTLAEVSATLRRSGTPSALPLLPAERDLDPGQALTARLRAVKPSIVAGSPEPAEAARPAESTGAAARLRAASRDGGVSRQRGRRRQVPRRNRGTASLRNRLSSWVAGGGEGFLGRLPLRSRRPRKRSTGPRTWVLLAVIMTIIGGAVMVRSWSSGNSTASVSSAEDASPSASETPSRNSDDSQANVEEMSESQIFALLDDLCRKRSEALSAGDDQALAALTVPDSSAAAADELLDLDTFVGNDYTIELNDPVISEQTHRHILVEAQMSTSVKTEGDESGFAPAHVEFELAPHDGAWRVLAVTQINR